MADASRRVSVRISVDGAQQAKQDLREVGESGQRSLERIKDGTDRASRALDLLDGAVRGVQIAGLSAGVAALARAGDQLTQSLSRLQNAVGSVERASEVYERLYRDALLTGVAVKDSVDAFQRFSVAAREIGATSDEVARLVGSLQRVGIISGSSTQEISATTPSWPKPWPRACCGAMSCGRSWRTCRCWPRRWPSSWGSASASCASSAARASSPPIGCSR